MIGRAIALVLGVALGGSALHALANSSLDPLIWLLDLRFMPAGGRAAIGGLAGAVLVAFGLGVRPRWLRRAALGVALAVVAVALADCVAFWRLWTTGALAEAAWLPASLGTVAGGVAVALAAVRDRPRRRWPVVVAAAGLALLFPLLPMVTFGRTDYRRPADAVLVLGARVYADGTLSAAASDRLRAAVALYQAGLVSALVLSGGPGDGATSEATAMARAAEALGVPLEAMVLDDAGLDTRASVRNTARLAAQRGWRRVLATSHFYHLPRIKVECERVGLACFTVPAPQQRVLLRLPIYLAREVAAWWRAMLLPWV